MTTSFPSGLDSKTKPTSTDTLGTSGVFLDVEISDLVDMAQALEAKVGVDSSAVTTSLDYKGAHAGWTFVGCRGVKSAAQSLTDSTVTAIAFDAADSYDTNTFHDTVTNNTRFTVPASGDGYYTIEASVTFAASTAGLREVSLRKNGSTYLKRLNLPTSSVSSPFAVTLVDTVALVAADYIEITGYQTSGGGLNVNGDAAGNPGATTCTIRKVGV